MLPIRLLTLADLDAYRELRLLGLQESPTAFGSSYERESVQDSEFFAKRITAILNDANKRTELGTQNRGRVADHFSLTRMVALYEQLYERLASPSRGLPKKSSG